MKRPEYVAEAVRQCRLAVDGGDVDTIHNVREVGKDPNMKYKNSHAHQTKDMNNSKTCTNYSNYINYCWYD